MVLLACALFPSLALGAIQAGCSSDDSATSNLVPPDSGPIIVPEAGPSAHAVTVNISGKGVVVSNDGVPEDGGPNGFVGDNGGTPVVDCPGACSAPQGSTIYAYPQTAVTATDGGVITPGYLFSAWTAPGPDGGIITVSTFSSLTILPSIAGPLTANFIVVPNGLDASVPLNEEGGGPTMPFQEAGSPSDDSGSEGGSDDAGDSGALDSGDAGG